MLDNSRNEIRKIQSLYLCKLYHVIVHCTVHSTYSTVYTHVYCIWSKVWAVCGWKVNLKKNKFFEYAHIFWLFINLLLFLHSLLNLLVFFAIIQEFAYIMAISIEFAHNFAIYSKLTSHGIQFHVIPASAKEKSNYAWP